MRYRVLLLVIVVFLVSSLVYADVPRLINFQGRLTDLSGKFVPDGSYSLTFKIYSDSTGGSEKWSESQLVSVTKGLFNVLLGSVISIPDTIFNYTDTWLGIQVGADPEMSPRQRLASLGYTYRSLQADTADYARAAIADEDWTISGNDIYRMNGNIGIGTSSPDGDLHVRRNASNVRIWSRNDNPSGSAEITAFNNGGNGIIMRAYGTTHTTKSNICELTGGGDSIDDLRINAWGNDDYITFHTNNSEKMRITTEGNVGIGTTNPQRDLDIAADIPSLRLTGASGGPVITLDKPSGYWEYLEFREAGASKWQIGVSSSNNFYILNWPSSEYVFYANASGDVGIGTTSPAYKLDVDGDINVSGSYNVKRGGVNYTHPDYVFEPDYKLMSLGELKKYVFENKSLPNVISADDVKKNNGFKMDELMVQMLEKIEEQTLYIFQLEENISKLGKRIAELEKHKNK